MQSYPEKSNTAPPSPLTLSGEEISVLTLDEERSLLMSKSHGQRVVGPKSHHFGNAKLYKKIIRLKVVTCRHTACRLLQTMECCQLNGCWQPFLFHCIWRQAIFQDWFFQPCQQDKRTMYIFQFHTEKKSLSETNTLMCFSFNYFFF